MSVLGGADLVERTCRGSDFGAAGREADAVAAARRHLAEEDAAEAVGRLGRDLACRGGRRASSARPGRARSRRPARRCRALRRTSRSRSPRRRLRSIASRTSSRAAERRMPQHRRDRPPENSAPLQDPPVVPRNRPSKTRSHAHRVSPVSSSPSEKGSGPQSGVAVVTDSTTYLPAELFERWGIQQVSLSVGWGGRPAARARVRARRLLRAAAHLPRPALDLAAVGRRLPRPLRAARRAPAATSSPCTSPTASPAPARAPARRPASLADRQLPGRVEVVDGETGAGGLGCLVLAAARAAQEGASLDDVVGAIHRTRERLEMWFCLETLEYLRRGGRIGAAQSLVGSALKIKPILTFGTEITPVGRVRTRRRAQERMFAYVHELKDRGAERMVRPARPVRRGRRGPGRGGRRRLRDRAALLHPGGAGARRAPRLRDAGRRPDERPRPRAAPTSRAPARRRGRPGHEPDDADRSAKEVDPARRLLVGPDRQRHVEDRAGDVVDGRCRRRSSSETSSAANTTQSGRFGDWPTV